ncbi:hypothetical protein BDBG_09369 [Blastomyces gilchristii SLH14081]|uniref:Uncharacterized protein n=2 Tax=Blastomyces TaxID=229219 RepID=A0A179V4F5_BLAGS|nr:uncharacterized protein BDBG_09369 [Blastomyces gilchristii SLH14081]EQL34975.1 hypothetical protein BDFG_03195 [Blastomyces dermatitidis ATCC 26199]KMW67773.1 hypothetical protein BDDG_12320 [Blastomyces dermatitidis ATCC 18188]OAT14307.1 hypothetical protein BDBG_09369 [Blastomyces gilchristii SLH14081]
MRRDRAAYRNIRFHDASTGASIGSFYQNSSITEENLIWILNDVLLLDPFELLMSPGLLDSVATLSLREMDSEMGLVPEMGNVLYPHRIDHSWQDICTLALTSIYSLYTQMMVTRLLNLGLVAVGLTEEYWILFCRDSNTDGHVSDELLRWHFRQSVLANMHGAGEPIFESDFPSGQI